MKQKLYYIIPAIVLLLSFRLSGTNQNTGQVVVHADNYLETGWYYIVDQDKGYKRYLDNEERFYFIDPTPIVTAKNIVSLEIYENQDGDLGLSMKFDDKSIPVWEKATKKSIRKKLAFIIDDRLVAAPTVMSEIPNGTSAIAGRYTREELLEIKKQIQE